MNNLQKLHRLRGNAMGVETFIEGRFQHCSERIRERQNMTMSYEEWEEMNLAIFLETDKSIQFVDMGDSTQSTLYKIVFKGQNLLVAFSETQFCMMTVFPRSDTRLKHVLQKSYQSLPLTDAETVFLDRRREIAEQLPTSEVDIDGHLIVEPAKPVIAAPPQNTPFAAALAGFKPSTPPAPVPAPVEAPAAPVRLVEPIAAPAASVDQVTEMFGRLDALINERAAGVVNEDDGAEQRIADIEAQIADLSAQAIAIREDKKRSALTGKFLDSAASMAESAFEQFREGLIDKSMATKIAHGLFLQLGESGKLRSVPAEPVGEQPRPTLTHCPPGNAGGTKKQLLSKEERRRVAQQAAAKRYGKPVETYFARG